MDAADAVVAEWTARDRARVFLASDRGAIDATEAARALVVDLVGARASDADLFSAFSTLGRLLAEHGGSPTLASMTLEGAQSVLAALDAASARGARAALVDGYVTARIDTATGDANARWEFPSCAVPLEDANVAIAAGYPEEDDDALAAWAARVANAVARKGYRRATLSGGDRATRALYDALELAGVKVRTTSPPAPIGRNSM